MCEVYKDLLSLIELSNKLQELKKENESLKNSPYLQQFYEILGWQGGTIHQVLDEVKRLKRLEDQQLDVDLQKKCTCTKYAGDGESSSHIA